MKFLLQPYCSARYALRPTILNISCSFLLAAFGLSAPRLWAQQYEMPEIMVVAPYLGSETRDVPQNVRVIAGREIDDQQPGSLADVFYGLPGVDVTHTGTLGQNSTVLLRGADPEHTLILFDEMDATDPLAPSGTLPLDLFPAEIIERVEVTKGPQSTLYGSRAIGGVVNIVTRRGQGPPRVTFGAAAGNLKTRQFRQGLSGSSGGLSYNFFSAQSESTGWGNAREIGRDEVGDYSNPEKDGFSINSLSGRVGYAWNSGWDLEVLDRDLDTDRAADNGPGRGGDDSNRDERYRTNFLQSRINGMFFGGRIRQRLSVSQNRHSGDIDNPTDALHPNDFLYSDFDSVTNRLDWRWQWSGTREKIVAGFVNSLEKGDSQEIGTGPVGFTAVSGARARETGGYIHGDLIMDADLHKTSLRAGGRTERHSGARDATTYSVGGSFTWKPAGSTLSFNQGTGFRVPSLVALFSAVGNPDLKPEKAVGRDLSLEQTFLDRPDIFVSGVWTWFRNDVDELVTFNYQTFHLENVQKARMEGQEFESALKWRRRWTLAGTFTLQEAVERTGNQKGPPLLNTADRKGSASLSYAVSKWGTRAAYRYQGRRYDEKTGSPRVRLPSYALVDVSAWTKLGPFTSLKGSVKNLFNRDYEELYGFGTPPRQVQVGLEMAFGGAR